MASGSATRDVHLFNSIIGVYQLSYRRVHCRGGGKSQAGVCTCSEWARLCQSLPWAPALSGVSGGTRTSPPLISADISIHEGPFRPVGLLMCVQVWLYDSNLFPMWNCLLLSIFYGGPLQSLIWPKQWAPVCRQVSVHVHLTSFTSQMFCFILVVLPLCVCLNLSYWSFCVSW